METINTIGRRKTAVARVYLKEGKGNITINDQDFTKYFGLKQLQYVVTQPLMLAEMENQFDIKANLSGGGDKGQAEAMRLAIARAITKIDEEKRPILKSHGLMMRDPREVERKKPGRPKARKNFQFSKR